MEPNPAQQDDTDFTIDLSPAAGALAPTDVVSMPMPVPTPAAAAFAQPVVPVTPVLPAAVEPAEFAGPGRKPLEMR
jgi:hypothetical protein